jgi:hypothetical protein
MKHLSRWMISMVTLVALLIGLSAAGVSAQGGGYTLEWFSIDNGGGQSSGGAYALNGGVVGALQK